MGKNLRREVEKKTKQAQRLSKTKKGTTVPKAPVQGTGVREGRGRA